MPARLLTSLVGVIVVGGGCATSERRVVPPLHELEVATASAESAQTLRLMTLNTAHGRGRGPHQLLQRSQRQRANLDRIAAVLRREQPALVALQEADGECVWSGGFNHVRYLAESGGLNHFVRGALVDRPGLSHGIALMSNLRLEDRLAVTFKPVPGATAKGFVISTIEWPGQPDVQVDVVSLHLEAFRPSLRERQAADLAEILADRERPLILMGDFNTHWNGRRDVLRRLATALDLDAYQPGGDGHASLPLLGRRLDWILISEEFEFVRYDTLDDTLSDHRAIVAEVALRAREQERESALAARGFSAGP